MEPHQTSAYSSFTVPEVASREGIEAMAIEDARAGWRTWLGLALFVVSIGWPVLIPILPLLGASATVTASFSGVMIVLAEMMLILGAAVAGKEGFAFIKATVFGYLSKFGPPREVSRRRHRIGLVMFVTPLAFGWVAPYLGHHLPEFETNQWIYGIAFDAMLLISLFLLGGQFWDKLQALFRYDAVTIVSPNRTTEPSKIMSEK